MTLKLERFIRKPFPVDGVQVTEENMPYVAEWCKGTCERDKDGPYIQLSIPRAWNVRQTKAYATDWVLKLGKGFKVYTNPSFHKTFEKPQNKQSSQRNRAKRKESMDPHPHEVPAGDLQDPAEPKRVDVSQDVETEPSQPVETTERVVEETVTTPVTDEAVPNLGGGEQVVEGTRNEDLLPADHAVADDADVKEDDS